MHPVPGVGPNTVNRFYLYVRVEDGHIVPTGSGPLCLYLSHVFSMDGEFEWSHNQKIAPGRVTCLACLAVESALPPWREPCG